MVENMQAFEYLFRHHGCCTYDMEIPSSISVPKLFKAFVLDSHNLIPKILPAAVKSVEFVEGNGGAGSIKLITFGEGKFPSDEASKHPWFYSKVVRRLKQWSTAWRYPCTSQLKHMKQRVDGLDKENFTYSYNVVEGDALMGELESISYHIKVVPSADGGSVCTNECFHFTGTSQLKHMKQRVDGLDKENFTYSYSVVEGDALMGELESISYHIKVVPSADGGSVCKNRSIYHMKGDSMITGAN
ncbi:hypothetical protein RJ640_015536 [Escallonia rubra]|uniref:Bet v I/Major latex protein domain-containing protein n=1 Tax=Escallonia rubra TaxID=112253 RepID=A0AA88U4Q8_9ASTE|nr:hypothetical protein RJ640_015536 [Escallonia rubra]